VRRTIVWFSAGAASAVAAKLTPDATYVYVDPGSEHPDNRRFIDDVSAWIGHPVETIKSDRYVDTWQVWNERRFLVGPTGALCTAELKKRPRFAFQRPDDVQVFGYTAEEAHRAERFRHENPGVELACPLIERGLTKDDCLAIVARAGIELPVMYQLGFRNNNCIGCPKGGMGYWNHIRRYFPDTFERMAELERYIGHSVLKDSDGPIWLDELNPDRGDMLNEPSLDCSLLCAITEVDIAPPTGTNPSNSTTQE
jgi:3'-phosphoadenosine 5'-phosphosulfate sulfotransferase (PAPS reductase)/FAD synthetase